MKKSITDCHVNIWNTEHYLPEYYQQMSRVRPGKMPIKTDADSLLRPLLKLIEQSFSHPDMEIRLGFRAMIR